MDKQQLLEQIKESLVEISEIDAGLRPDRPAKDFIRQHGGSREGSGAKKKNRLVKLRGVNLTDQEYKQITGKYGTFAAGVRSLLT